MSDVGAWVDRLVELRQLTRLHKRARPLDEELRDWVGEQYESGVGKAEIKERLGIHTDQIGQWLDELGIEHFKSTRIRLDNEKILDMHEQGYSRSEIARELDVSSTTIGNRLRELGVPDRRSKPKSPPMYGPKRRRGRPRKDRSQRGK